MSNLTSKFEKIENDAKHQQAVLNGESTTPPPLPPKKKKKEEKKPATPPAAVTDAAPRRPKIGGVKNFAHVRNVLLF